jgi:hypothetical protein
MGHFAEVYIGARFGGRGLATEHEPLDSQRYHQVLFSQAPKIAAL